jgi:hypothetical protein
MRLSVLPLLLALGLPLGGCGGSDSTRPQRVPDVRGTYQYDAPIAAHAGESWSGSVLVRDLDRETGHLLGEYALERRAGDDRGPLFRRSFHGRVDPDGSMRWYFDPGWTHHGLLEGRDITGDWNRWNDGSGGFSGEETGAFRAVRID